jgi:hypothetical protein
VACRGRWRRGCALGAEPVGSASAELAATLRAADAIWGEAVRAAGSAATS